MLKSDLTWMLERIIDNPEAEKCLEEYAEAILALTKIGFGEVYLIDEFIEDVRQGGITNYDGVGSWIDGNGNTLEHVNCNVEWLKNTKNRPEGAKFIAWFNK